MNKLTELQKVIDDFWQSYSNPFAFDKPIIKIVDVFDDLAKSYLSKALHDIRCFAVVKTEHHYADENYEKKLQIATEEVCFRLRFDQEELLLKELKEYFYEETK